MRYREVAMDKLKKMAGVTAAQYVKDGMVVGLGTGSTAYFFVEEIGRRMKEEGLQVTGVTTSSRTTAQAQSLGSLHSIALSSLHSGSDSNWNGDRSRNHLRHAG